jgi:HPt (histidine-containing phosphotransfer) domain-containing protein
MVEPSKIGPINKEILDDDEAIKKLGDGDPSTFIELAASFDKDTLQPELAKMKAGIIANDYKVIRDTSHAIKGVCKYLQANRAANMCEKLHKAIDDKKYDLINTHYPSMIYEFTLLKKEVRKCLCKHNHTPFVETVPDDKNVPVAPKFAYALSGLKK